MNDTLKDLVDFMSFIIPLKDERTILDLFLLKSRKIGSAIAGTIYLREKNNMVFVCTHNDDLFPANTAYLHAYQNVKLPINLNSIVGYVATTSQTLNIEDVSKIPDSSPFKFNSSFDHQTGFTTKSVLTIPLVSRMNQLRGVLQLINSQGVDGKIKAFSREDENKIMILAKEASDTLEIGFIVRAGINRFIRIANLHDSAETGPHSERVGALAAELYQYWAEKKQIDNNELIHYKSHLRLAAMLHDIGKVGVSDMILKKHGKLTDEERQTMCTHTYLGATLFDEESIDITELVKDTTLHHHQKWDGTGYSGHPDIPVLSGNEIPLAARLTSIADVFDALVSERCYKRAWSFPDAFNLVRSEAGHHFDPELANCFLSMHGLIKSIYNRYPDI